MTPEFWVVVVGAAALTLVIWWDIYAQARRCKKLLDRADGILTESKGLQDEVRAVLALNDKEWAERFPGL